MGTRCKASALPRWLGSLRLPHFPQPRRRNRLQTINQGVGPFYSIGVGPFYVVKANLVSFASIAVDSSSWGHQESVRVAVKLPGDWIAQCCGMQELVKADGYRPGPEGFEWMSETACLLDSSLAPFSLSRRWASALNMVAWPQWKYGVRALING